MIVNKITDKITKVSKTLSHNNLKAVRNKTENLEPDREIPRERCISLEERQKIVDDLRMI